MDKLTYEFKNLRDDNRGGSFATQKAREEAQNLIADQLKELGFNQIDINALGNKHAFQLVEKWNNEGLKEGTMKNRMAHFRWSVKQVNPNRKISSNKQLGIKNRIFVTNVSKAVTLEQKNLDRIKDPHVKDSLRAQEQFGMRREESMKVNFLQADKGTHLKMKGSWCKNGRPRDIPILTNAQRTIVNEFKEKYGNSSLIPPEKSYVQQMTTYKNTVSKAELTGPGHGLRHKYAQDRYKTLTRKDCPAQGGKRQREMTKEERIVDKETRLQISEELGHSRDQVTSTYLGS